MIALVTSSSFIVGGIALASLLGALILVKVFGDSRPHS
jgi:hypothetical protein